MRKICATIIALLAVSCGAVMAQTSADDYLKRGNDSYNKGDYDQAIADYTQAISLAQNDTAPTTNQGKSTGTGSIYGGSLDGDESAPRRVLDPKRATAYHNRGLAYYGKGDYDQAITDYTQAINFAPNDAATYYNRGLAYSKKGGLNQAITDWEACLRINPNHANAKSSLAEAVPAATAAADPAPASDFVYELNKAGNGIVITGYKGKGGIVKIPASIEGFPVVTIGKGAFRISSNIITSVSIPDSVTSIEEVAFGSAGNLVLGVGKHHKKMTSVTIGNGVKSIGNFAFRNCVGLVSVTIPDSVTSIGDEAFSWCEELTSVTIGNGVKNMGFGAFYRCYKLTSVTIGNGVTSIGDAAFALCSLASIVIPDSVTNIGKNAFYSCKLTSVTISPVKGRKWSNDAFEGNSGMNIASQSALRKAGYTGEF